MNHEVYKKEDKKLTLKYNNTAWLMKLHMSISEIPLSVGVWFNVLWFFVYWSSVQVEPIIVEHGCTQGFLEPSSYIASGVILLIYQTSCN